jgi:hypothetical protein
VIKRLGWIKGGDNVVSCGSRGLQRRWMMKVGVIGVGLGLWALVLGTSCTHTKEGTHVEMISMDGRDAYVAGAAGMGLSKSVACRQAIGRAARAVAHRFAQEHDDLGEEVAEELGAGEGAPFLYGYVNQQIVAAPVQDISYDHSDHSCLATVRWQPPVFLKEALMAYGRALKEQETAPAAAAEDGEHSPETVSDGAAASGGKAGDDLVVKTPPAVCQKEKAALATAEATRSEKLEAYQECKRRTGGDREVCHRYGLWVEKTTLSVETATRNWTACKAREL